MEQLETYLRLAPPRKAGVAGILSLIFSRLLVVVLIIGLQIAAYVVIAVLLLDYLPHLVFLGMALVLCVVLWLFNTEMDASAKLTWMFLLSIFPLIGAALLAFTQLNVGHRKLKESCSEQIRQTQDTISQDPRAWERLEGDPQGTDDLVKWLNRSGCFPVYDNTEITYFPLGEDKFEAMLEELRKAEDYIFMEYFIIEEGFMWGSILEILIEKAKAGVDVRVMYDGMCEISHLPGNYTKLLEAQGIRARSYAPIVPMLSSHYNYRDHRKILVIDGRVAFNGGVNLADEYINRRDRFGHWKDTALMIKGPAVKSYTLMFLQMWNIRKEEPEYDPGYFEDEPAFAGDHPGFVVPYSDCPLDGDKVGEMVYMDILNRAAHYVHIMTPYLILDGELELALKYAAQRGVDVKLILPGIPDKKMAYSLAKSHYAALTRAGVKIYEYTPGFVHAKVFVSDDIKAVVGTINMDYRSLYHHFECATYLYQTECISEIEEDFRKTLAECREVTEETIRNESLFYKIMGRLMKIVAPLM